MIAKRKRIDHRDYSHQMRGSTAVHVRRRPTLRLTGELAQFQTKLIHLFLYRVHLLGGKIAVYGVEGISSENLSDSMVISLAQLTFEKPCTLLLDLPQPVQPGAQDKDVSFGSRVLGLGSLFDHAEDLPRK